MARDRETHTLEHWEVKEMKVLGRFGMIAVAVLGLAVLPVPSGATECTGGTVTVSLSSWDSSAIHCGDKTFTLNNIDLVQAETTLTDSTVTITAVTGNQYTLEINFVVDLVEDLAGAFLNYTVTVDAASPDVITAVNLDVTQDCNLPGIGGSCTVEKDVLVDGSLVDTATSSNGSSDSVSGLSTKEIVVNETFSITGDAAGDIAHIFAVQNTILQTRPKTPLPGTLVMLGMGLLGAGILRYRKGA
jgi:hypothetical protein